jgi:fatty-acid desaturase
LFIFAVSGYSYWWFAVSAVVFFLMNPIGIAVTYHRYWSHKSFEFKNTFLKMFCTFWAMASGAGSILGWVGIHRDHHAHSDKDKDPHQASRGYWAMINMSTYDYKPSPKKVADMLRDPFITLTHKYYFAIPLGYAGICFVLFGIEGLIFGFSLPAAFSLLTQNTTNYVNHLNDDSTFKPANVAWINLFNFGDGWHKNHHDNPLSYTTKVLPHEHDPAGWVIRNILSSELRYGR